MAAAPRRRGCLFLLGRGIKWFAIALVLLVLLGVAYQTLAMQSDLRSYTPRGQLYDVDGHQMHIVCQGEGSPAVVLEAGGYAESLWWSRVQAGLAEQTQVCAYDRPGMGYSEPTTNPRDPLTLTGELHGLLGEAGIAPPYVLAGHSYGAILTRIFADQYPDEVRGLVLVDSGILRPAHFASEAEYNDWKSGNDILQAVLWVMTHTGIMRLTTGNDFSGWGYPAGIVPELVALHASNQAFDTYYAETFPARVALNEAAAAAEDLGDLPMVLLWAGEQPLNSAADLELFEQIKLDMAAYSANSVTRVIDGADHGSILGSEAYAPQVVSAILDVIDSAGTGEPLVR
ncbi:MAG: alpha/beta hydrolase [Anaerolineae bacterium]|nr:alpha/beta hydrolase [Anaerolineae bacterium]